LRRAGRKHWQREPRQLRLVPIADLRRLRSAQRTSFALVKPRKLSDRFGEDALIAPAQQ
jgi:hypothetical protein